MSKPRVVYHVHSERYGDAYQFGARCFRTRAEAERALKRWNRIVAEPDWEVVAYRKEASR